MTTTIDLCDNSFSRLWEVGTGTFEGVLRANEPGEWRLETHLDEIPPDVLMQVEAIMVRDAHRILFCGYRQPVSDSAGGTARRLDDRGRRVSIEGMDCWIWMTSRVVFPDPDTEEPWAVATDARDGVGGTKLAEYLMKNIGSTALTDRRIPDLEVMSEAVGASGRWSGRLQRLSDLAKRIADESGLVVEPRITIHRVPQVHVREASDRSAEVVIADIADLAFAEQRDVPARSTWVLAAGSGTGASRMFRTAGGGTGFARRERVVEATSVTTSNELHQIAEANRRNDGFAFYVTGRLNEHAVEQYQYLEDYELGDIVTVQVRGIRFPVPISAVTIRVSPERTVQTPTLGTYTPNLITAMQRRLLGIDERFGQNIA